MACVRWAVWPTTVIFNFSCRWVASFLRATRRSAMCFILDFPRDLLDSRRASRQILKFVGSYQRTRFAEISGRPYSSV